MICCLGCEIKITSKHTLCSVFVFGGVYEFLICLYVTRQSLTTQTTCLLILPPPALSDPSLHGPGDGDPSNRY